MGYLGDFTGDVVATESYFGTGAAGINAAIQYVADRGAAGGRVIIPNIGAIIAVETSIVLPSWIELIGVGRPQLRLADGVNAPIITSANFVAGAGTAHQGIRIRGLYLDCNKANQSSGHGVTINSRDLLLEDLYILNAKEYGLYTDYNGSTSPHGGRVAHLTVDGADKHGWFNDLSDLHADDINIRGAGAGAVSTYDGIHCASTAGGMRASNINVWSSEVTNFTRYGINLAGDGNTLINVHAEAGGLANVMIDGHHNKVLGLLSYNAQGDQNVIIAGDYNQLTGSMYPGGFGGSKGTKGVQIGVTAGDTAAGNIVNISTDGLTGGSINVLNSAGANDYNVRCAQNSVATVISGSRNSFDRHDVWANGVLVSSNKHAVLFTAQAAAGSATGNATVLTNQRTSVTSDSAAKGVRISSDWTVTGHDGVIVNASAVACLVYPHSAGNFQGLSADIPITLPARSMLTYYRATTGGWGWTVGIPPTTTNDSAPAGLPGEYIETIVLVGASVSLTTNTATDIASVAYTAGDWDVSGVVTFGRAGTTSETITISWVNNASATNPTAPAGGKNTRQRSASVGTVIEAFPTGVQRFSAAGSGIFYLGAFSTFTVSTSNAYGTVRARRVR